MTGKVKGSLTVFFAMVLVAVMTLIFTMSECIRAYELHGLGQEYTDMAIESAFSEYNPYLWQNYRILAVDLGYGTDYVGPEIMESRVVEFCRWNSDIEDGQNYIRLVPESCRISKYSVLTDGKGQGVVNLGVKAAKDSMAAQVVDYVQGQSESVRKIEKVSAKEKAQNASQSLDDAKRELEEAKKNSEHPEDYPEPGHVEDDPFDAFEIMQESISKGVLSTVVSVDSISDYQANPDILPSHRTLNKGNIQVTESNDLIDKALYIDYLLTNYSCYSNDKKHAGLKYEIEYLIAGQETDTQSLAAVVEEIMLVREAANYASIMSNGTMVAQAGAIAEVLAGFTMNPAIIEGVKYGIIGAWAYIESTLDLRTLLAGGEVPLMKNIDEWTSDVYHLSSYLDVKTKAKEVKNGISYRDYLIGLLATKSVDTLGLRSCDVLENALSETEDYKNVKLDNMIFLGELQVNFSAKEMFLSLFSQDFDLSGYAINKSKLISY